MSLHKELLSTVGVVRDGVEFDPTKAERLLFRKGYADEGVSPTIVSVALHKKGAALLSFEDPETMAWFRAEFLPRVPYAWMLDADDDTDDDMKGERELIPFRFVEVQP